jgi:hypothetical protein
VASETFTLTLGTASPPGSRQSRLRDIMNATGLSESFASTVRSGRWRLHVSHWPALAALAEPTAQTR